MTKAFIILIITVIVVFDVATLTLRGYETTISWELYSRSLEFPVIPFSLGFICGHLFWPNKMPERAKKL